jgi:hypothetical protein
MVGEDRVRILYNLWDVSCCISTVQKLLVSFQGCLADNDASAVMLAGTRGRVSEGHCKSPF